MKKCSWENCQNEGGISDGFKVQLDRQGKMWAFLCSAHVKELNKGLKSDAKGILRSWILAKGGTKAAAKTI